MKCPNCGYEMQENSLYCENCGEDIHIVPDFEPEIELNIDSIISEIADKTFEQPKQTDQYAKKKEKGYQFTVILSMIITAVIVAGGFIGFFTYQYYSVDYQITRAKKSVEALQYDKAVAYYERALELEPQDITIMFALAETYFLENNKIEYEYMLRRIVADKNITTNQLESAYGKLIAIYRTRKDYNTIQELLLSSNNEKVMTTYQDYIANPPEFSVKSGYYTTVQPLKITAVGKGRIYYTIDGSEPTKESLLYSAPIILEEGDYLFRACFVNENGTKSKVVSGEYHVEIDEISAPEIGTISGEYSYPTYIVVLGDDEEVYYTTDGSNPNLSSYQYTEPIPMPLGKSVYKFAKIIDGVVGNIAECTYHFTLNTQYFPEQAQEDVIALCIQNGKIRDEEGHFDTLGSMYTYSFQYVIDIEGSGHYYVIAEVLQDSDGVMTKTGNYFAVDAYQGEIFKLQRDGNNNYTLVEIQNESLSEG